MAATVNNMYKYSRDLEEERLVKKENERIHLTLAVVVVTFLVGILFAIAVYRYRQHRLYRLLEAKAEQNRRMQEMMINQRFETETTGVIERFRQSSKEGTTIDSEDWMKLYRAIRSSHPSFIESIENGSQKLSQEQLRLCLLLYIGIKGGRASSMLGISESTAWRWERKIKAIKKRIMDEGSEKE